MTSGGRVDIVRTHVRLLSDDKTSLKIDRATYVAYDDCFVTSIGDSPELQLIEARNDRFAHEAGVYISGLDQQFFTSNWQSGGRIDCYSIDCKTHEIRLLSAPRIKNANGACNYRNGVLFCDQGDLTTPSALLFYQPRTGDVVSILDHFHDRPFNSINDVVVHPQTGDIWFTDPTYGYEQGFRGPPRLPSQVYRFNREKNQIWCVADGFVQCNGLCFSPGFDKMYITDTGAIQAHGTPADGFNMSSNPRLPASIYVYDVVDGKWLANRQMFAYSSSGVPDGIKCDDKGNVYSGCGDGVHVWDSEGTLIGKIYTGCVVGNLNFSPHGLWIMAEEKLFLAKIRAKGALESISWEEVR
ncbi:Hypothetical protein D9617_21g098290 [Elsinoe fawcettii]|nr:Hypothetical protein D9617_21g098290 [Elsinoe fawcettii]